MSCQRASSVSAYPAEHCERLQRNRPQVRDARELPSVVGAGDEGGGGSDCWISSSSAWLPIANSGRGLADDGRQAGEGRHKTPADG
jgi:hypothetical protein